MRVAEKVCSETGCSMKEAIRRAVAAHNTVEDSHGYTPSQWAFGRQPNWHGNLWRPETEEEVPLAKMSNQAYKEGLQRQTKAQEIMRKALAQNQMTKARNAATRKTKSSIQGNWCMPGDKEEETPPMNERQIDIQARKALDHAAVNGMDQQLCSEQKPE